MINPLIPASRPYLMTFKQFQYTFVNSMPLDEQKVAYDISVTPESRRLGRDGLGKHAKIDFEKEHAPLLFIAGEIDHIMPASLNKTNFKRYKAGSSVTAFPDFYFRSICSCGEKRYARHN